MKLAKDKAERIYRMLIGDPSGLGNSKRFTEDGEGYSYTLYLGTLDQDEVDSLLSMIRTLCPSWTRIEPKHQPRSYKKEREEKAKKAEMVSEYWDAEELTPASAEYF